MRNDHSDRQGSWHKRRAHGIAAVIGVFFLFQNCGQHNSGLPTDSTGVVIESDGRYKALLKMAMDPETLSAWFSQEGTEIIQSNSHVSELRTLLADGVSFSAIAGTPSPQLIPHDGTTTATRSVLHFLGKSTLQSPYNDNLGASSYAVVAVVSEPSHGRLLHLKTDQEGDSLSVYLNTNEVRVEHVTDSANSRVIRTMVPANAEYILAISLGPDPDSMRILINGIPVETEEEVKGTPQAMPFVWRQGWLGDAENDVDMTIGEFMIFKNSLSDAELNAVSFLLAEHAGISEVEFNPQLSQARPGGYGDELPTAIRNLLESKCYSCHQSSGIKWTLTIPGLTTAEVLMIGKPEESSLYTRLISGDQKKKMPLGGSLPADEIELIRNWIQGL